MGRSICFFGGATRGEVILNDDHPERRIVDCDLWFDRDIDGRWLVGATTTHDGTLPTGHEDKRTGAIIVRDPGAIAFIEMLSELIADPVRFHHEPIFTRRQRSADEQP